MKYNIITLAEALKTLKKIPQGKSLNEEMNCVLIKDGKAWATNGVVTMSVNLGVETEQPILLTQKATDIIISLKEPYIDIEVKNKSVNIKSSKGKYKFAMGDVSSFVLPEKSNTDETISILAEDIKSAIKSVAYAVAPKSNRKEMTGIYFNSKNGKLEVVGCDGVRLAISKMNCENSFSVIVPMETARLIMALKTENNDDMISVTVSGKNALFSLGDTDIYTLLYAGNYLDYNKVINSVKEKYPVNIDCEELKDSLQRAIACWDSSLKVPLEIVMADKKVSLKMNTATINFDETLEADCKVDLRIGVNPRLMLEALNNVEGEAKIEWSTPVSPIYISDENTNALVLPVRLKD